MVNQVSLPLICPTLPSLQVLATAVPVTTAQRVQTRKHEFAKYEIDASATCVSDAHTRGISVALLKPGLGLSMEMAHHSGLVGMAESVGIPVPVDKRGIDNNRPVFSLEHDF